jgi:hypothetical protein
MSRVNFKIGRKGVTKGVCISQLYDESELDTLDVFAKKENSEILNKELKESIASDVDYSECTAMHTGDGAYIELIDEETNTTLLINVSSEDGDGNPLYLESCYDEETDTCNIDMDNNDIVKELLGIVADSNNPDIEINDDTVSFNESENLWCDMTLVDAIKTCGLQDRYGKDVLDAIESGNLFSLGDGALGKLDREVSELEHKELMLSNLVNKYKGKCVELHIGGRRDVLSLDVSDTIDINDFAYELTIDIAIGNKDKIKD